MLANIRIVLQQTSHPGNIGSVARAMKTMGIANLYLVAPKIFPAEQATAQASHATDILQQAVVVPDLITAIADCQLVIGASCRNSSLDIPLLSAREAANFINQDIAQHNSKVAIVFGTERTGLTKEELLRCQYLLFIPVNPDYQSLNLAQAVQIVCYELYMLANNCSKVEGGVVTEIASAAQVEKLLSRLERLLLDIQFYDSKNSSKLMQYLRRFYNRARPDTIELNIWMGILKAIEQHKLNA